jgi:hypothetical protein
MIKLSIALDYELESEKDAIAVAREVAVEIANYANKGLVLVTSTMSIPSRRLKAGEPGPAAPLSGPGFARYGGADELQF